MNKQLVSYKVPNKRLKDLSDTQIKQMIRKLLKTTKTHIVTIPTVATFGATSVLYSSISNAYLNLAKAFMLLPYEYPGHSVMAIKGYLNSTGNTPTMQSILKLVYADLERLSQLFKYGFLKGTHSMSCGLIKQPYLEILPRNFDIKKIQNPNDSVLNRLFSLLPNESVQQYIHAASNQFNTTIINIGHWTSLIFTLFILLCIVYALLKWFSKSRKKSPRKNIQRINNRYSNNSNRNC